MSIYRNLFVYGLLLFSVNCYAGCPDTLQGQSANYQVTISDNGCSYDEEMIQIWKFRFNKFGEDLGTGEKPDILIPFSKECKFTETGFSCHRGGKTPLAGTAYKRTKDENPQCPGEEIGVRLTCINGCTKKAPKYFSIVRYEC